MTVLPADAQDLETAEEFLVHFGVPFDQRVVNVYRLHILQRFHDYLASAGNGEDAASAARASLERAYNDFAASDAHVQRVFKGRQATPAVPAAKGRTFLPLSAVARLPKADQQ